MQQENLVTLTADIVAAHVSNNNVSVGDLGGLIRGVHGALFALSAPPEPAQPEKKSPAVSVRASVKPDYLVCMECGSRQKMLKRHLTTAHRLTPAQYRADYALPLDYPMVAPNYSESRRALAHSIGLGRKRADAAPAAQGRRRQSSSGAKPAGKRG
jgi:predicted transcriptional regulator